MPKAWFRIKSRSKAGFSPVEVLLAATIFGFLATALIGAIIYGRSSTADAGERVRAQLLADEGVEAVRNIRDAAFANVTVGTYGLVQSGGAWTLSGSSDVTGIFTRQVAIATVDASRKSVTVTVTWPQGAATASTTVSSQLTNWLASLPVTTGPIMMAYSKTTTTPFYRTWDGTTWSAEASAQAVVGNINYVVLKSSKTRNEAILGVQTSTGAIYVQIWNGTAWGTLTQVGTGPTTTRSFDIAYEQNSGRAIIAYTPSSGSTNFAYRTWDGTTLSAGTTITMPNRGAVNWMELRQNPLSTSNEVAMIMLDAKTAVYGMVWTGSAWSNMGDTKIWDTTAATATQKTIAVNYEQTSGKAMFMWGDSVATNNNYRTWDGTTLSANTLLTISTEGGISEWVDIAARPNSNELFFGVQDAGAGLNTRKWSGSAWDTATQEPEHSTKVENTTSKTFDIVWETASANPGKAWLMWGDGATITKKQWSGTAWGTGSILTSSDDTSFIKLRADPVSGTVFAGIYEDATSATKNIWESRLTGGGTTWSAKNTIWAGPTSATPVFFRIDIATP
jgi:Tfp pilus assembly protein PilV